MTDEMRFTSRVFDAGLVDAIAGAKLHFQGMTLARLVLLRVLDASKRLMGCSEIADKLACTRQNVEQIVDRLVPREWVEKRSRGDEPRRKDIVITEEGRFMLANAEIAIQRYAERVASRIAAEEALTLHANLASVRSASLDVKKRHGVVTEVEGKVHPDAFRDPYIDKQVRKRLKREAEGKRWKEMPTWLRAAYQQAEMWGDPVEKVLEEWGVDMDGNPLPARRGGLGSQEQPPDTDSKTAAPDKSDKSDKSERSDQRGANPLPAQPGELGSKEQPPDTDSDPAAPDESERSD